MKLDLMTANTKAPSARSRLDKLNAELANLPSDIDAAEIACDDTALASLLVRERIINRQVKATELFQQREAPQVELLEAS